MATNLSTDPGLLAKALEPGGEKTRKAAVDIALREFIVRREQMKLRELFGRLEWSTDFDCKHDRTRS